MQNNFTKMRGGGGGQKGVWNFSKNPSDLVAGPIPYSMFPHLGSQDGAICRADNIAIVYTCISIEHIHDIERRYSARLKTLSVCNIYAPVNPINQGTSCAG